MAASSESAAAEVPGRRWRTPPLGPRTLTILFVVANVILVALPLVPQLFLHGKGKDYPLWYGVGRQVLTGGPLYHETGHGFGFLYPPVAAVLLAPFSLFGRAFSILCIGLVNVASWWAAAKLSDRLAGVPGPKAWWVVALPSVIALPFVWDMYDLGQPNLMLLAIELAGLALLAARREWAAGAMFAAAAALKAFPLAVFPYLLWRRRWKAAASMAVFTAVFLLIVPAPFRGLERNYVEVKTWANAMVFSANEKGFGQRPEQNWGWKNNSLIAVVHRYTRPINAEAEHPEDRPIYVNVLDLSYDQANIVLAVVAGVIGLGFIALLPPQRAPHAGLRRGRVRAADRADDDRLAAGQSLLFRLVAVPVHGAGLPRRARSGTAGAPLERRPAGRRPGALHDRRLARAAAHLAGARQHVLGLIDHHRRARLADAAEHGAHPGRRPGATVAGRWSGARARRQGSRLGVLLVTSLWPVRGPQRS